MAVRIDTQSSQYQQYLNGLEALKGLMAPRLRQFAALSKTNQRWWLLRDPLMRKVIKMSLLVAKHVSPENYVEDTQND